ncbi:hypothetical protein EJ06DRAFT_344544 [Trichodelitschia bisporula]|uniref:Uncharacterized protein n=1 Tax=Trichodelitschia bisporula TaxID=703511 RepID=A0A6G1I2K3_9PEZI|nr:hypothetical protein EJ06DRAFT_344544 [Trichodelitschia bisporula]
MCRHILVQRALDKLKGSNERPSDIYNPYGQGVPTIAKSSGQQALYSAFARGDRSRNPSKQSEYLRDAIIGFADGLTVPFVVPATPTPRDRPRPAPIYLPEVRRSKRIRLLQGCHISQRNYDPHPKSQSEQRSSGFEGFASVPEPHRSCRSWRSIRDHI